ncbi:CARDB domain-containing protein [Hymenobacter arizonensis]|uniref:Por secretion system C-terminal sorting domain-containing protein n=1 Tax=Hymenobacter arizonensis TaxID=1227077 RepID=A0A1I6AB09_HYMAR|nr:CARDB domain-containing protein [Hymenobacter arizonensis]SFQ65926.1 Por secretion system C-terminal sorting domain-containing protein [Hymenobacter arizonensis]
MKHIYPAASRFITGVIILLILVGVTRPQSLYAQTYLLPYSGSTNITACSGTLYDNGGANGPYSAYANGSTTITPAIAGNKIKLQFTSFAVENGFDAVYIYDGAGVNAPLIGVFSSSNPPGTVYGTSTSGALTVRLTSDGTIELNGFVASIECVTTVPPQVLPDLTVQGAWLSVQSVVAGGSLSSTCSIYNLSGSMASSSSVGYYLSTDAVLSAADQLLGNSQGFSLAVGQSSYRYGNFTVPPGTAPGNYYVLFAADYLNQVSESNENNNVVAVNITVTPPSIDLTIQQAGVTPLNTAAGNPISMSCYILNQGNATANSSSVGFYFSTNATLDASDQLLTSQYGSQLSAHYSEYRSGTAAIPLGVAPGTYYILFVADYQNQVNETNENNNVSAVSITISPPGTDLIIQHEQLYPSSTVAGNSLQVNATIVNQGNMTANSSTVGFYLSTNTVLDAGDVLLSTVMGGSLGANQTNYRSAYPVVPVGTAPGSYYVLFVADPQDAVVETNETNNVRSLFLTVQAPTMDLSIQSVYLSPVSVAAGGATAASCYLYNQGNATATPATVGYYLSTNAVLDASDVLLGSTNGSLSGGNSSSRYINLTVPAGTAIGSYYVLFVADYLNQVVETNENNNLSFATLQVVPPVIDLTISQIYVSTAPMAPGSAIATSCYINNIGNAPAASSTVGYYLSTNSVLDAGDVLMLTTPGGTLGANQSFARYDNPVIPAGTTPGSYFILFVADPQNVVAETNENNNVASQQVNVVAPGIDLLIQQPMLSGGPVTPGFSVSAGCAVHNAGNTTAPSSSVDYYLSTNQVWDASDVLLSSTTGFALSAGQSSFRSTNLVIPTGTTAGTYYVLFVADPQNVVAETNENNNVNWQSLTVLGPFAGTLVPFTGTATVTTCSTTIYDNGGYNNYADNSSGSLTIRPATPGGMIQLVFNSFLLESGFDYVRIYDGVNTNAPLLGTYTGNQLPPLTLATNVDGALTVEFTSDGSVVAPGFDATVTCGVAPQSDLVLTQIGASPSTLAAGGNLSLSAGVANHGAGPAASSAVGYYLSTNRVLDASDRLLGTSAGAALGAGLSANRQLVTVVPGNVTPGAYYVLFVADPLNVVSESDETNNMAALAVTVSSVLLANREQTAGYTVAVAPNPVAMGNGLRVELSGAGAPCAATMDLYNALGQRVRSQPLQLSAGRANRAEVATQGLASGVYSLRITGPNLSVTRRVVIE